MYSSVINNDNYINSLLNKQGDQLLKYNHSHIKNINISRILETCNSSVCSVRETMDQNDSSNVNVSFNDLINEVKDKEKAFNRKLKEYTHLQKRINGFIAYLKQSEIKGYKFKEDGLEYLKTNKKSGINNYK